MFKGVVFDLDDTLVDTSAIRPLRNARRWKEAVRWLHETRLFVGIDAPIRGLSERGISRAVVPTAVSFYADQVIARHRLGPVPLVAYHDATPKPSPAPVVLALQRSSLQPSEVIGVGDAETDLIAYRAAGVRAVGAGWSPILHARPWDVVVARPLDVLGL